MGETRAVMETESDEVPAGSTPETFARGGCEGQALQAIPGIWAAPRSFESQLEQIRAEAAAAASVQYRPCVAYADIDASTPNDLEYDLANDDPGNGALAPGLTDWEEAINERLLSCDPVWTDGYKTSESILLQTFLVQNSNTLEVVRSQYAGAMDFIRADNGFLEYLANAAGISERSILAEGFAGTCEAIILGTEQTDSLSGTAGSDCINGKGGNDSISGGGGNDHIVGGTGNDSINGGSGDDVLEGDDGQDSLLGGDGADTLDGGNGENSCHLDEADPPAENCFT